jgi:hypothetical protein
MATRSIKFSPASNRALLGPSKLHRFGEHGILLALPVSVALWTAIGMLIF